MAGIEHDILCNFGGMEQNNLKDILHDPDNIECIGPLVQDSPYIETDSISNFLSNFADSFSVMSLNTQSLNAKFDSLVTFLSQLNDKKFAFSAICLQETWIQCPINGYSLLSIQDYTTLPLAPTVSTHSGLVTYLHKSFTYKVRNFPIHSDVWEGQFLDIYHPNIKHKITICNIYRPPRENVELIHTFISDVVPILEQLSKENSEVLFLGDFNLDLLKVNQKAIIGTYLDTFVGSGFIPSITLPTRIHTSATLIDNIFYKFSNNVQSIQSGIILNPLSDHLPCFSCINFQTKLRTPPKLIKIQTFNETALNNFITEIESMDIVSKMNRQSNLDPNINYQIFEESIKLAKEKHFPIKTVKNNKRKHKLSPWITKGIINSINYRDKLYKQLKTTSPANIQYQTIKQNLKVYNSILKTSIRNAKASFYHAQFERHKHDSRKTWNVLNKILHKNANIKQFPEYFKVDGDNISDKQTIADRFNNFFATIGSNMSPNLPTSEQLSFMQYLKRENNSSFSFHQTTPKEIEKTISKLQTKNSSGHDDISSKVIKGITRFIAEPLSIIINQSFETGIFPDKLKLSKVIPIFKKDDDTLFTNYRPISLLPVLSKVFEKVAYIQFYNYLKHNKLLYCSQHGFRSAHSTETAAYELIDKINSFLDNGFLSVSVFLDLSKAFDVLDHTILIEKLRFYGVIDSSLDWFISYLNGRHQFTLYDDYTSNITQVSTGVPQGSVLGPLLFLVYINDIYSSLNNCHTILYADDTTLTFPLSPNHVESGISEINKELSNVHKWLKLNKLILNANKTRYIVFHYSQRQIDFETFPELFIDGTSIVRTQEFNFLGLLIHENLNWKPHISKISIKIARVIGTLRRLQNILPPHVLKTIYNSLILPHINYCILAWGNSYSRILNLQKKSVRVMNRAKYNAHTSPLFKNTNILTVPDIFTLKSLKFYYKYKHKNVPSYFDDMFTPLPNPNPYPTRNSNTPLPQTPIHSTSSAAMRYTTLKIIDAMPPLITEKINTHSYEGFSTYIKRYLIGLYPEHCVIRDCYVCNS